MLQAALAAAYGRNNAEEQRRAVGIAGKMTREHEARRKEILAKPARRKRGARAMSVVDDVPVWVIPCITVRKG
jgi:hypothetical protein